MKTTIYNGFYQERADLRDNGAPNASFGFMENIRVGEYFTLYDFLHGHCDEFAAGLSDCYGYSIECIIGSSNLLVHAYCTDDLNGVKAYIDVRGITTDANLFFDEFSDFCKYDDEHGEIFDLKGSCQVLRYQNTREMYCDDNRELNKDKEVFRFLKEHGSYYDIQTLERMLFGSFKNQTKVKDMGIDVLEKYGLNAFSDATFRYQMLDRLRMDCEYYLGNGNRYAKHLWAGDEKDQIEVMKALWGTFAEKDKPEWLPYEKILEYEENMTKPLKTQTVNELIADATDRSSSFGKEDVFKIHDKDIDDCR